MLAVAGTHGKTTTASLLAWILEHAGRTPSFLIGGVPENFGVSARLASSGSGEAPLFVIEADEYDTAFFDKRSKFLHYRPRTLILNNLEYDHADIFPDLAAIQNQFHHLVRIVPRSGKIIIPASDLALAEVMERGCWTPTETFGGEGGHWQAKLLRPDGSAFELSRANITLGEVEWGLLGIHNVNNALAAIAAAAQVGVAPERAIQALPSFRNVKRRLEQRGSIRGVTVYDDFAHHPTAIALTLGALRARVPASERVLAVLEPRSNTMRLGVHKDTLAPALSAADRVFLYQPADLGWDLGQVLAGLAGRARVASNIAALASDICSSARPGDHILIMSNGGFGGIHDLILKGLAN